MRLLRLVLLGMLVAGLGLALTSRSASAHPAPHPMGNFTINHYSALTVGGGQVAILYVLDMAEIPTYQELGAIHPDHSPTLSDAEKAAYIAKQTPALLKGLTLTLDKQPLTLAVAAPGELTIPVGAGGLSTLRLVLHLAAPLGSATQGTLQYKDDNYSDRIGWKEIIAKPAAGTVLHNSSVPQTDESVELTQYRSDLLTNPPVVTSASLAFAPGTAAPPPVSGATTGTSGATQDAFSWAQLRSDALTDLIGQKEMPLGALLIGLLVAFGFGAGHALSPGHGKTVVAAYLVGSKGTAWNAAFLGLVVTVSHTIGVFLLGLVVLYASEFIVPETLYPWLGTLSGGMIAVVGLVLFVQRWRAWRRNSAAVAAHDHASDHSHDHDHEHDHVHAADHAHGPDHDHDHDHNHTHDHNHEHEHEQSHDAATPHSHGPLSRPHTHVPADGQRVTLGGMLLLGITGGIIPCPSALVVLLAAIAYHQIGLGMVLIIAFSLGLALVLTGIGIAMVYGRGLLGRVRFRLSGQVLGRLPLASALVVSCLGILIAVQALTGGLVLR